GGILAEVNKPAEAEACFREAVEKSRRVLGDDHPDTIDRIYRLGMHLGATAEGRAYLREAIEGRRRVMGETHPATLIAVMNAAQGLKDREAPAEAEKLLAETVAAYERAFTAPHPTTAFLLMRHANLLLEMGRADEAEAEGRKAVNMYLEHPVGPGAGDVQEW